MEYLDFVLEIGDGRGGREYPVHLVSSPAGEARETMQFPFDELALENHLKSLQIALLRSGGKRRKVLSQEEETVRSFGQALFDALVKGEVRSRYDVSCQQASQQEKGLRLKLRIHSPDLAALPWEFVYDSREGDYLCLSRHKPVVRYIELPRPPEPLAVQPPLRILGMIASPKDQEPLNVEREKGRMERALEALQKSHMVTLTWLRGQTWDDLQQAMWVGPWHVFHFIGHGGFDKLADEGMIALADKGGQTHRFTATDLGRLLADHKSLRLVFLNSCEGGQGRSLDIFSSTAAILVKRGLPAVVAMQYEISDTAAIELARAFYRAVAAGLSVDEALAEARKAISFTVPHTIEWATPVLYMRAPAGVLFNMPEQSALPHVEQERVQGEAAQESVDAARPAQEKIAAKLAERERAKKNRPVRKRSAASRPAERESAVAGSGGMAAARERARQLASTIPSPRQLQENAAAEVGKGRWKIDINVYGMVSSTMVLDLLENGQLTGQQSVFGMVGNLQGRWSYDPRARLFVMQVTGNVGGAFSTDVIQIQLTGRDGDVLHGQDNMLRQYAMQRLR